MNPYPGACLAAGALPMPDIMADPPSPRCYSAAPGTRIKQSQSLDPDLFPSRARDARGRFAGGHSGNRRGRPPGIPNPRRRLPDLLARPLSPAALSALIDRKPRLLRALAVQLLPPPRLALDPADRLGIDLSSVRTADDLRQITCALLAAISGGEIGAAEGAIIARRARARLRAARRLKRRLGQLARRPVHKTAPVRTPIG